MPFLKSKVLFLISRFVSNPVLVVIDIEPKASIPTEAFVAIEEFHQVISISYLSRTDLLLLGHSHTFHLL